MGARQVSFSGPGPGNAPAGTAGPLEEYNPLRPAWSLTNQVLDDFQD